MPTERIQFVVQRFFDNVATPEEIQELAMWVETSGDNETAIKEALQTAWHQHTPSAAMPEEMSERLLSAIFKEEPGQEQPGRMRFLRRHIWWAAASLLLMVTGAIWWSQYQPKTKELSLANNTAIPPGSEGALLTLADGSVIVLDTLQNGVITNQGHTSVKIENGQLIYDGASEGPVTYNTMTTPKGRQFRLLLPDGSQVWLNAASSITYPTVFSGSHRKVTLKGEAYFDIAQNPKQPFQVQIDENLQVQVLGTQFNINAYGDEQNIKTTLIQGSVKLFSAPPGAEESAILLKPGQQGILTAGNQHVTLANNPDIEEVMAWKNGIFYFRNANLPKVMMQLERWYDINVTYAGPVPVFKITGKMDRGLSLEEVLDFLGKMEVKYKLSGKTVTIFGN